MKITDYLAIYAAILSTSIFLWNVFQSSSRLRVDLIFGVEDVSGTVQSGVCLCVRNVSSHELHVASLSVLYPYKVVTTRDWLEHLWKFKRFPKRVGWVHTSLKNYAVDSGCPVSLGARKSHQVFLPAEVVESVLAEACDRKLMACAQDQLWHNVYSQPFEWNLPRPA